jgi:hypothetical protein
MMSMRSLASAVVALVTFAAVSMPRSANAGMYFAAASGDLSASAYFDLIGNTLTITVTNNSTADVLLPTDVLTGVFFNTAHSLTPVSASLNGSSVFYGSIVNSVGEGWQYQAFATNAAQGKNAGISAAGLGLFGPNGNFYSGSNPNLQGLSYGLLSAGDNSATGNSGVTGKGPLIKNSVIFTLNAGNGFSLSDLGETIVFQYGTDLSETHFSAEDPPFPVSAPEPTSIVLWGVGIAGLMLRRRIKPA